MYAERTIEIERGRGRISVDAAMLKKVIGVESAAFAPLILGDIHSRHATRILTYVKDLKFVGAANSNAAIKAVLCRAALVPMFRPDILPLICDDPNWSFFSLIDHLAKLKRYPVSSINSDSIGKFVSVSGRGVNIGYDVAIEPFVTIHAGTTIGNEVILRSGSSLGIDTFQHQRTSRGLLSPKHDGALTIGNRVEIGAQSTVSKGFSYRDTVIGDDCKIDAGVYIGHGANIGKSAIICAGAKIMGHSRIGDDVFIGPGAIVNSRVDIGDGARVSLGAVVTKNVTSGQTVTGNFAVPHNIFMATMKSMISEVKSATGCS